MITEPSELFFPWLVLTTAWGGGAPLAIAADGGAGHIPAPPHADRLRDGIS